MSDKENSKTSVITEIKDTDTFKSVDKSISLIPRAIHAALSPLEVWIMNKEFNIEKTKRLLEKKLANVAPENIITPPSYIAVPALQSIVYCMDDDELREMYAELLARAMDRNTVDNVHPTYVEIIKQMSPYDAIIFRKLLNTLVQPCIGIKYVSQDTRASYPIHDLIAFPDVKDYPIVPTQISLENLERLKLIEIHKNERYNNDVKYEQLKLGTKDAVKEFLKENKGNFVNYKIEYDEFVIVIRAFGQFFARACMGTDFSNVEGL